MPVMRRPGRIAHAAGFHPLPVSGPWPAAIASTRAAARPRQASRADVAFAYGGPRVPARAEAGAPAWMRRQDVNIARAPRPDGECLFQPAPEKSTSCCRCPRAGRAARIGRPAAWYVVRLLAGRVICHFVVCSGKEEDVGRGEQAGGDPVGPDPPGCPKRRGGPAAMRPSIRFGLARAPGKDEPDGLVALRGQRGPPPRPARGPCLRPMFPACEPPGGPRSRRTARTGLDRQAWFG